MNLSDAITLVIADTRSEDPDRDITDVEIIAEVRAEIDVDVLRDITDADGNRSWDLTTAYALVVAATDDEIG